jgi:hypothetical protein
VFLGRSDNNGEADERKELMILVGMGS